MIEDPRVGDRALEILKDKWTKPSEFANVLNVLASYVQEKPKTTVEHKGNLTLPELVMLSREEEQHLDPPPQESSSTEE